MQANVESNEKHSLIYRDLHSFLEKVQVNSSEIIDKDLLSELYHLIRKIQQVSAITNNMIVFRTANSIVSEIEKRMNASYQETDGQALISSLDRLTNELNQSNSSYEQLEYTRKNERAVVLTTNIDLFELIEGTFELVGIKCLQITDLKDLFSSSEISYLVVDGREEDAPQFIEQVRSISARHTYTIVTGINVEDEGLGKLVETGVDFYLPPSPSMSKLLISWLKSRGPETRTKETISINLKKEWDRFQRFHSPFSLAMVSFRGSSREERVKWIESIPLLLQSYQSIIRVYDDVSLWDPNSFLFLFPASDLSGSLEAANRVWRHSNLNNIQENLSMAVIQSEHIYGSVEDMLDRLRSESVINKNNVTYVPLFQPNDEEGANDRTRFKLLCVDEDLISPTIIQNHLDPSVWEVRICYEAAEALEWATLWNPDAILCESRTPLFDGFLFASQIRQIPSLINVPIVFLSSTGLNKQIIRSFQVGGDDYITKPFSASEVEARILRLMKIHKRMKE